MFIPVAFASGQMGSFLTEFGVTVSVAVIISLIVALTLTPMLASRMPPPKERGPDSVHQRLEVWFQGLEERYTKVLEWSLANRGKTTLIAVASIAGDPRRVAPRRGVHAQVRLGLREHRVPDAARVVPRGRDRNPGGEREVAALAARGRLDLRGDRADEHEHRGPSDGMLNARLKPRDQRERSAEELMRATREALSQIPGQEFSVVDPMATSDHDFQVEIIGNASLEELDRYSDLMLDAMVAEGMVDVEKSLRVGLPEALVVPDRDKAAGSRNRRRDRRWRWSSP